MAWLHKFMEFWTRPVIIGGHFTKDSAEAYKILVDAHNQLWGKKTNTQKKHLHIHHYDNELRKIKNITPKKKELEWL